MVAQTIEERGQAIYDTRLKSELEAKYPGQGVAIHLASGHYIVHPRRSRAAAELFARYPGEEIYSLTIGSPTTGETMLATLLQGDKQ